MTKLVVNVNEHPYLDHTPNAEGRILIPGLGHIKADVRSGAKSKFLGDPEQGPWIYWLEVPAGTDISRHAHKTDRTEFVSEGEIEWQEDDGTVITYGAGSLSFVTAGTFYQYRVLKDAKILVTFFGVPGDSRAAQ
jgi:hypothetical protein